MRDEVPVLRSFGPGHLAACHFPLQTPAERCREHRRGAVRTERRVDVPSKDYGPDCCRRRCDRGGRCGSVDAEIDLVVEAADSGFCGAIVAMDKATLTLEDRHGRRRLFGWESAAYLLDGETVTLASVRSPPRRSPPRRTASGSVAVHGQPARVARASRILVEGLHDCELVERIWGADLRVEGVVVEQLQGADNLAEVVRSFGPERARPGSGSCSTIWCQAARRAGSPTRSDGPHVLVVGHPFVDIWQAVKPERLGLRGLAGRAEGPALEGHDRRPARRGRRGCRVAADPRAVRSWTDLEPELLGPVEALIDFVTASGS